MVLIDEKLKHQGSTFTWRAFEARIFDDGKVAARLSCVYREGVSLHVEMAVRRSIDNHCYV